MAEIGPHDSCIVLEDIHSGKLRFMRVEVTLDLDNPVKLVGLGLSMDPDIPQGQRSIVKKFRSSLK